MLEKYKYDAFGEPVIYNAAGAVIAASAYNNRFLFTGREWAPANLGFYEYRARAYHPGLGRFMSEDPKGFDAGDYNLFRYCDNDPEDRTDPMGLFGLSMPLQSYSGSVEVKTEEIRQVITGSWIPQVVGTQVTITVGRGSSDGNSSPAVAGKGGVDAADRLGAQILRAINPQSIASNKEKIFVVYNDPNTHRPAATKPITTTETGLEVRIAIPGKPLKIAHTHGAYSHQDERTGVITRTNRAGDNFHSDTFSQNIDIPYLKQLNAGHPTISAGLLGTPSGKILKYDIATGNITEL